MVSSWLDKVHEERTQVQKWFKKLDFFSTNLKPRSALDPENLQKIDLLVKSAFDCHLDKEEDPEKVIVFFPQLFFLVGVSSQFFYSFRK